MILMCIQFRPVIMLFYDDMIIMIIIMARKSSAYFSVHVVAWYDVAFKRKKLLFNLLYKNAKLKFSSPDWWYECKIFCTRRSKYTIYTYFLYKTSSFSQANNKDLDHKPARTKETLSLNSNSLGKLLFWYIFFNKTLNNATREPIMAGIVMKN